MSDLGFVVAAYGAVFFGLGLYVVSIWRRSGRARAASLRIRRDAEAAALAPARGAAPGSDAATDRAP